MPLIIESPDHQQRLELSIAGYEFPEIEGDKYDSNWLTIRVDVQTGDRAWSAEHPSLLTIDVQWLADWFDALASGHGRYFMRPFIDPCLAFRADPLPDGLTRLRVYFGAEMYPHPPSPGRRRPPASDKDNDIYVEFALACQQLQAAAQSLRAELSRYPARMPSPDDRPPHTG